MNEQAIWTAEHEKLAQLFDIRFSEKNVRMSLSGELFPTVCSVLQMCNKQDSYEEKNHLRRQQTVTGDKIFAYCSSKAFFLFHPCFYHSQ